MSQKNKSLRTYISPDGWYVLMYPDGWEAEVEEECTSLYKKYDGVGGLQISAYETDIPQSARDNILEYLNDEGIHAEVEEHLSNEGQHLAGCSFENDSSYTRIWFVTKGKYLLFITYICDPLSKALEEPDINIILSSLHITN